MILDWMLLKVQDHTIHKIQKSNIMISSTQGINYKFTVQKYEGIERIGTVQVWNDEIQRVIGSYSLSLFKKLVDNRAYNTLNFLNYLSIEGYQELVNWLNNIH